MTSFAGSEGLIVRLEGGQSGRRELHLDAGRPHLPFAVGEHGDWKVMAAAPGSHVMIAYNGCEVFVGAVGSTDGIAINGKAAESRWTRPLLPAVVSFGDARIVIDEEHADDPTDATVSPAAESVRFAANDALTAVADEELLSAAIELARTELGLAPTSNVKPLTPPPRPRRPQLRRLITRPWDKV